jgi:predicted MFS family arabinose efflux permease
MAEPGKKRSGILTGISLNVLVLGLVMLHGGLIAGLLWESAGPWGTFAYGMAMSVGALALLLVLTREGKDDEVSSCEPAAP